TSTATSEAGRASASTAKTCVQSVPWVARYRQPSETAMPIVRRRALARRDPFYPRRTGAAPERCGPAALSPARWPDESAGGSRGLPPEPEQGGATASDEEHPGERLPIAVEPDPEAEHQEETTERRPRTGAHDGPSCPSARTARVDRSNAVHMERMARTTIASSRTTWVGRWPRPHATCATRSDTPAPKPSTT